MDLPRGARCSSTQLAALQRWGEALSTLRGISLLEALLNTTACDHAGAEDFQSELASSKSLSQSTLLCSAGASCPHMTACRSLIRHPLLWRPTTEAEEAAVARGSTSLDLCVCPTDVLLHVLSFLDDYRDLCRFSLVCRAAAAVAFDDQLWRTLALARFPAPATPMKRGWHALFRFHTEVFKALIHPDLQTKLDAAYPRLRVYA